MLLLFGKRRNFSTAASLFVDVHSKLQIALLAADSTRHNIHYCESERRMMNMIMIKMMALLGTAAVLLAHFCLAGE